MPNKPAVALDPSPPAAELLAAKAAGLTWLAWRDAGKPVSKTDRGEQNRDSNLPRVRPWYPYRSKWEAEYAKYLDALKAAGRILSWEYEAERLEIGVGAKYTPDFRVVHCNGFVQYREVKGYRREAAMVRLKAAALRYPGHQFLLVTRVHGEWRHSTIGVPR